MQQPLWLEQNICFQILSLEEGNNIRAPICESGQHLASIILFVFHNTVVVNVVTTIGQIKKQKLREME